MDLERSAGRIFRLSLAIAAMGSAIYFFTSGWRGGCGFLLGGIISSANFHWLKRTVEALGAAPGGKAPRTRTVVFLGLRYLLLGAGAYAILKFSEISLKAALVGLFAPAAAVILEILIELIVAEI